MGRRIAVTILVLTLTALGACARSAEQATEGQRQLTLYSGRSEELVGPLVQQFERQTGIDVQARYGDTAALASTILEEGDRSPADVFWAQDAGALGAVEKGGRFSKLPQHVTDRVAERFRSANGQWVGVSGRARVLVYNRSKVPAAALPASVIDLTAPRWRGRVGWAPTNGSFQAFVTALRVLRGEAAAKAWLEGMKRNGAREYEGNAPIVQAVASGEIDAGLVNHYYLLELGDEDPDIDKKAGNHFFRKGDPGNLINVAGIGILKEAKNRTAAEEFASFLLSRNAGQYFDEETIEYPLQHGANANPKLRPLDQIGGPEVELADLSDLQGTLKLLRDTGVL